MYRETIFYCIQGQLLLFPEKNERMCVIRLCVYLTFGLFDTHHAWSSNLCSSNHPFQKVLINVTLHILKQRELSSKRIWSHPALFPLSIMYVILCWVACSVYTCRLHILWQTGNYSFCRGYVLCGQIAQDVCSCKKNERYTVHLFFANTCNCFPPFYNPSLKARIFTTIFKGFQGLTG